MSTQAYAVAEMESTEEPLTGTVIEATVLVTAQGSDDLSFSSSSSAISIKDKDITLQPLSSQEQPVLYNLIFRAGPGVALFATPAAEFHKDGKDVALAINPSEVGQDFRLSFVNNLPVAGPSASYAFDISWMPSSDAPMAQLVPPMSMRRVTTDPTILLDPPNS
jgi:hypothetical protein